MVPVETQPLRIGVLALQGSFREHAACLKKLGGVNPVEVRTKAELESVDGLIVPGGESTTMALIAERWGLLKELRAFSTAGRPVWGTCAGLIFLASNATGQKIGGQQLLGGIDCCVSRNFFGAQINSFEANIDAPSCFADRSPFRAVFIRAPAVLETGPDVEVLATYHLTPEERKATGRDSVVVGVRSKQLLATAFHPELTEDLRWHELFVDMVAEHIGRSGGSAAAAGLLRIRSADHMPNRPADIPVYGDAPRW